MGVRAAIRLAAMWLCAGSICAGQPADALARLVERVVAGEERFLAQLRGLSPLIETYIQEFADGDDGAPRRDHYMLGRFQLRSQVEFEPFVVSEGFRREKRFLFIRRSSSGYIPAGFAQMVVPDAFDFNDPDL